MKIYCDNEVDALYLKLGDKKPEGVVELSEGVNLDQTSEGKIVEIEILNASNEIKQKYRIPSFFDKVYSWQYRVAGQPLKYYP